ncbi:MAG TPA: hypothetical protein DCF68_17250 [Cyanothece sp. UBA12306]|nr:hypothetical protein [Cyanothece sp. UBA12306]
MTQSDHTSESIGQGNTSLGFPLGVICNPSTEISVMAGERFVLRVTIANQGSHSVRVDLTIEDTGEVLSQCCRSPHTAIGLEVNQTSEVVFEFSIPYDTPPQISSYILKLDSPRDYKTQLPKFYQGTVRILPPIKQARDVEEPTFTIHPLSHSYDPLEVQGGELVPLTVEVHNRSSQVDRFYLSCRDFRDDWFKIIYPEVATSEGMITSSDGLELNPGQKASIQFHLTLPINIKAGRYSPTLQILSANYGGQLALLDLIHLKVPERHQIDWQLIPRVDTVINEQGWYEIRLHNGGNTTRKLQLDVIDTEGDRLCQYSLEPSTVEIHPEEQTIVNLNIVPPPSWKRPFTGRSFKFTVEIRDLQGFPLLISQLPGILVWKQRPWWLLYLFILGILLLLGGLIGWGWWLLTKKPPIPKVISFTPQNTVYDAINDEVIRLNWQVTHPKQLATIQLMGVSPEEKILSQPITYDFSQGIPDSLQEFCSLNQTLLCTDVPTDGFKAGDYRFQLIVTPKSNPPTPLPPISTSLISINPAPKPSISKFNVTESNYIEAVTEGIKLNWTINNFPFMKQLTLSGYSTNAQTSLKKWEYDNKEKNLSNSIPTELQPYCKANQNQLVCLDFPTEINKKGKFVFQLTLVPIDKSPHPPVSLQTEPIEVKAKPIPIEIKEFKVDGKPTPASYRVNLQEKKTISLQWQVIGDKSLKVELLPVPGTVKASDRLVYPLSPEPKTETIILTAIDSQGQNQTRSVMIETYLPSPPPTLDADNQDGFQQIEGGNGTTTANTQNDTQSSSSTETSSPESGKTEPNELIVPPPPMTTDPQFR